LTRGGGAAQMQGKPNPAVEGRPRMSTSSPKRRTSVRKRTGGRAVHDIGGVTAMAAPIDRREHEPSLHEKRVDALVMLLGGPKRGVFKIDALRRVVESYAAQDYDDVAYYDKWMRAIRDLVVEQELVTPEELDARMKAIRKQLVAEGRTVSAKTIV
jgi:Nitrile hydratase beta subunit